MMLTHDEKFEFGLTLVREAGKLALTYFQSRVRLTITRKGAQDLVSEADLNTELLIKEKIAATCPEDAFLGEETGATEYSRDQGIWVVDPIDGTQPFITGLTSWCVSIAYLKSGIIQFGMVYAPARDELFAGGITQPATLNSNPLPIHPGRSIADGIVGVGYSPRVPPDHFLPMFGRLLKAGATFSREGSGALALCYVASGRLIGYIECHINSWDCLAALAILRAAGLQTSDFLAGDGLLNGNHLIVGPTPVYAELSSVFSPIL